MRIRCRHRFEHEGFHDCRIDFSWMKAKPAQPQRQHQSLVRNIGASHCTLGSFGCLPSPTPRAAKADAFSGGTAILPMNNLIIGRFTIDDWALLTILLRASLIASFILRYVLVPRIARTRANCPSPGFVDQDSGNCCDQSSSSCSCQVSVPARSATPAGKLSSGLLRKAQARS